MIPALSDASPRETPLVARDVIAGSADAAANPAPDLEKLRAYTKAKLALAAQLRVLAEILKQSGNERRFKQCEELSVKLAEDRFTLAVLGQFKRGKSSLMNAIVGRAVLPVGALPLTSAVTVLKYGPHERLLIKPRRLDFTFSEPVERLAAYVTEKGNPGNRKQVERATLELPVPFLRRGLEFVDTPGVGSAIEANTATTYGFLPACDAVLFVTSVETPLTKAELEFLKDIRQHVRKIFFVLNKTDLLANGERQEVLEFITQTIRARMGADTVRVFPVSARLGLAAQTAADAAGYAQSGLKELEEALARFLSEEKAAVFLAAMAERALRLLEQEALEMELHDKARAITEAALAQKLDALQARWREHATARRRLFDELRHHVAGQISVAVTPELQSFLRAERAKLSRDLERVLVHARWQSGRAMARRVAGHALKRLRRNLCRWAAAHAERLSFGADARAQEGWEQIRLNLGEIPRLAAAALCVAQVSQPAVSPISNRQGVAGGKRVEKQGSRPAGLETRDTADLEVCATRKAVAADGLPPWRLDVVFEPPVLAHLEWNPSAVGPLGWLPVRFAREAFRQRVEREQDRWMKGFEGLALAWIALKVNEALDRLSEAISTQARDIEARLVVMLTGKRPSNAAASDAALVSIRSQLLALRQEISGVPLPAATEAGPHSASRRPVREESKADSVVAPAAASDLARDLQTRGCAVCDHLQGVAFEFYAHWQYALCTEEQAQREFAAELGFCPLHTWQLEAVSSPLGLSIGHARLIEHVSGLLAQAAASPAAAADLHRFVRPGRKCRVCELLRVAEARYVERLAAFVNDGPGRQAYSRSQGVCLRHLGLLVAAAAGEEAARFLLAEGARRFEEMAEDMQSYAMKTEALRRQLHNQDEVDAYLRAVTHVVGARRVWCPWEKDVEI